MSTTGPSRAGDDGPRGSGPVATLGDLPDWRALWASYGAANLADGILLAAAPLLVTTLTRDPLPVAAASAALVAPTFVFSLPVGAVVDRADRRLLQVVAHAVRAVVLLGVAGALALDALTLGWLYAAILALGTAEVVADTAGETLVAAVVPDRLFGTASSRLIGTSTVANRLAGPPVGAGLFALGLAAPWATAAVLLLAASVLVSRVSTGGRPPAVLRPGGAAALAAVAEDDPALRAAAGPARLWHDVVEGWRFTVATRPVRRLALLIAVFNLTFGAVLGIQVLWALERLGLDAVGYGTLLTASAVGGLAGSALFPRLERRFSYATLLRAGLVVESLTHVALGLTTSALVAGGVLVVFGVHEAVWGSLSGTIRLRVVPEAVLGRVNSVYRLAVHAPLLVGAGIGGLLAERFGILAPFWYAAVGAGCTTALVWRSMDDLGSAAEGGEPVPAAESA